MSMQRTDQTDRIYCDENGEVVATASEVKTTTIQKGVKEDHFIKIYYDTYLAAIDCNGSYLSDILIAIGKRMSYSTEGQIVSLSGPMKQIIALELGISVRTLERAIKTMLDKNLLRRIGGRNSTTFYVSPFILAKGQWNTVQALRLEYSKLDGTVSVSCG